jgi:F1F0 ATPase subunit 2
MIETLEVPLTFLAGGAIGFFFFGGLWWTIQKGFKSERPAFWFLGSVVLRMAVALGGFYLVADHKWQRWLICLSGFFVARLLISFKARHAFDA